MNRWVVDTEMLCIMLGCASNFGLLLKLGAVVLLVKFFFPNLLTQLILVKELSLNWDTCLNGIGFNYSILGSVQIKGLELLEWHRL